MHILLLRFDLFSRSKYLLASPTLNDKLKKKLEFWSYGYYGRVDHFKKSKMASALRRGFLRNKFPLPCVTFFAWTNVHLFIKFLSSIRLVCLCPLNTPHQFPSWRISFIIQFLELSECVFLVLVQLWEYSSTPTEYRSVSLMLGNNAQNCPTISTCQRVVLVDPLKSFVNLIMQIPGFYRCVNRNDVDFITHFI